MSPRHATPVTVQPGAPKLHDEAEGNVCFRWTLGDKDKTESAFRGAAHPVNRQARAAGTPDRLAAAGVVARLEGCQFKPHCDAHP